MDDRLLREVEHNRKIATHAEDIWGWASPAGSIRAMRRARLIIAQASLEKNTRVLELGCGTGFFTKSFAEQVSEVIALELSFELIKQVPSINNVYPISSNAEKLPFKTETFDAVMGSSILHHLRIEQALSEIWRTLKPGGKIAFAEPNMANPQIILQKNIPWLKAKMGDSPDETAFFRWQIVSFLSQAGFVEPQAIPYDFLHPLIPEKWINIVQRIGSTIEKIPLLREIAGSLIISAQKK